MYGLRSCRVRSNPATFNSLLALYYSNTSCSEMLQVVAKKKSTLDKRRPHVWCFIGGTCKHNNCSTVVLVAVRSRQTEGRVRQSLWTRSRRHTQDVPSIWIFDNSRWVRPPFTSWTKYPQKKVWKKTPPGQKRRSAWFTSRTEDCVIVARSGGMSYRTARKKALTASSDNFIRESHQEQGRICSNCDGSHPAF